MRSTDSLAGRLVLTLTVLLIALRLYGQGGEIVRLDPKLDEIVSADAKVEKLASSFSFVEGPVWVRQGGYLLFSDIPANAINKWMPDGKVFVAVKPSGFTGADPADVGSEINNGKDVVRLIGSNGLTLDRQGRIVLAAHGDRAIIRIDKNVQRTVLADRYEGKRLNSPNDLVYCKSAGGSCESGVWRFGRQDALPDGANRTVSDSAEDRGNTAIAL
jgi:gluconolactonase